MENSDVNQRFINFIEDEKIQKKGFSFRLGVTPQVLTKWKDNLRPVTVSALKLLCAENDKLNVRWLLTGEGDSKYPEFTQLKVEEPPGILYSHCKICEAKDAHIKSLQGEIEFLKKTITTLTEPNEISHPPQNNLARPG